jgi:c-di-GMP-binding flagellar brake protein YcgR
MARQVLLWSSEDPTVRPLQKVLAELKVAVERIEDAAEAETRLREKRFDAVIVDGDENSATASVILQRARKSALNRATLILAVVGNNVSVREVFALGANFLLYKPISVERARASLKAAYALMGRERRRSARYPVHSHATIDYATTEDGQATLLDLSEQGTAIQSERGLPPSCKIYFKFALPEPQSVIRLSAEVIWQDSTGRVGLSFIDVPQTSRRALQEWLRAAFEQAQAKAKSDTGSKSARAAASASPGHPHGGADAGLARFRSSPGNRRTQSRRACQVGAEVFQHNSGVPHRCNLSDLSLGGCYVEMPSPFGAGSRVEVQVRTRDSKVRVPGVVLSSHPGFGMGVRFELRNATERERIESLLQEIASQARGLELGRPGR